MYHQSSPDFNMYSGYTKAGSDECVDHNGPDFRCADFDKYNFCTDTSSFASAMAHERCRRHCNLCVYTDTTIPSTATTQPAVTDVTGSSTGTAVHAYQHMHSPAHALTNTRTHQNTHSPTHALTNTRTHQHMHSPTHALTNTRTHQHMH